MSVWNAERLKSARKILNINQAELAAALGCRQQTVSLWEVEGHYPGKAYQRLLDLTFENLCKEKGVNATTDLPQKT